VRIFGDLEALIQGRELLEPPFCKPLEQPAFFSSFISFLSSLLHATKLVLKDALVMIRIAKDFTQCC